MSAACERCADWEGECWRCANDRHNAEMARVAAEKKRADDLRTEQQRQWFRDTGHCGVCGQPGVFCLCRKPCVCADLHECGSGIAADPTDVFAETPVSDGQQELFG